MADFRVYNAEKQSPPKLHESETNVFRTYNWLFPRWRYTITYFPITWALDGKFYKYVEDKVCGMGLTRASATRRAERRYQRAVRKVRRQWACDQQEYYSVSLVPAMDDLQ